ncbi:MAG: filamentous hemagglutinin N-terminal domain-containing protein [Symploca sp. SIO2D2]|nr:filamentous hemagglutinin N-terminal domain-containing protein [Symploca sp. SIO2D2]
MHFTKMSAVIFLLGRLIVPRYTNHPPLKKGKKTHYKSLLRFCLLPLVPLLGRVRGGLLLPPANAQIIPDATLGSEGSRIIEGVDIQGSLGDSEALLLKADRIEGGALRGANLFHSFLEFNVLDGQRVYFANPAGIENILSRVTGNNGSDILGTLGVLGNANLFLVNPNGIVFGPNAQLDVRGSLVASTENGFNFSDGNSFSATNPEALPLLAINVTPGIQWGTSEPQAEIVSQGNLTTGQDLTLVGSRLNLSGQLQAGRDLNLLATDTAKLHDSVTNPVIATSGRHLTMQGNQAIDIFTLNHPNSQLESGGDFTLISDGDISGDAHFFSGGNLSMQTLAGTPGNFVSWYDPIIRVNGDVEFGDYTGVALKVEATGSIKGGDIRITGPDATIPADDPDYATLTEKPSVILRAGLDSVTNPNLPQNGGGTSFIPPALGIPLGITVGNIDTSVGGFGFVGDPGNGGDIILSAANGSITTGNLISGSDSESGNAGNGGAISLIANNDINITSNLISGSSSFTGNGGNGGTISLNTNNNINITGGLNSSSFSFEGNVGNGGSISFHANDINITGGLDSESFSFEGSGGNGGAISFNANNINIIGGLNSGSFPYIGNGGNGGAISFNANDIDITGDLNSSSSSFEGNAGNGGLISFNANDIDITGFLFSSSSSSEGNAGNGGVISFNANDIDITGFLFSSSSSSEGNAGNGGAISFNAYKDIKITGGLNSFSYSSEGNAGNGGAISFNAYKDIKITDDLNSFSFAALGSSGTGGAIFLSARNGEIEGVFSDPDPYDDLEELHNPVLNSFSISEEGIAGDGGNVTLEAQNTVSNLDILTLSSWAESKAGNVQVEGKGDLLIADTNILTSGQVTVENPSSGELITLNVGESGQSGDVTVNSLGNLTFNNSRIESDTKGSAKAGNVAITSPGLVTFNNSQIISNTSNTGQAGDISISAPEIRLLDADSIVSAQTSSSGRAGNVNLQPYTDGQTLSILFQDGTEISASSTSRGLGGNIFLTAPQSVTLSGDGKLSSETSSSGIAGNVEITTPTLNLNGRAQVSTTTTSSTHTGTGGNLIVRANTLNLSDAETGILAETQGVANAGNLRLNPHSGNDLQVNFTEGARISASTSGMGTGGNLRVNANNSVTLSGDGQLSAEASNGGNAGGVEINTQQLSIEEGAEVAVSSNNGEGIAGDVNISASRVNLNNGRISAETDGGGNTNPANISLNNVNSLNLTNKSSISASTQTGQAGSINLNQAGNRAASVSLNNSRISAQAEREGGNAGGISLHTFQMNLANAASILASNVSANQGGDINLRGLEQLEVNQSLISTSTQTGQAGSINLNQQNNRATSVSLNNSRISAQAEREGGNAGGINLHTSQLNLANAASILASNVSANQGGDITLQGLEQLEVNQSLISTSTQTGQAGSINLNQAGNPAASVSLNNSSISAQAEKEGGNAGGINLHTSQLNLANAASILASNVSANQGGDITLQGLEQLEVNQSLISTSTQTGQAGSINLNQAGNRAASVNLSNSRISAQAEREGGNAGGINLHTSQLNLANAASILASNVSANQGGDINLLGLEKLEVNQSLISTSTQTGQAGNVTVGASDSVNLSGTLTDGSGGIVAEASNGGNAGGVVINTQQLSIEERAQVAVSSKKGSGIAGDVDIRASDVNLNNGHISAETDGGGNTNPANISLNNVNSLNLSNDSSISASTKTGQAGSINLNQANNPAASVSLNNSSISAQANGERGNAGGINLNTSQLNLANAAEISASNLSANQGGDINLRGLEQLFVTESLISTSTQTGQAGSVTVKASDSVNLSGILTDGSGGILAQATDGGSAGNVEITAPLVNIQDGAQVTVSSPSGQAGNLSITADILNLNRGQLTAITGGNGPQQGANINLELADALFLSNESLISAEAIGEANGGNITINLTSERGIFVAFPSTGEHGSDIIAKAEGGNGGRIDITSNLGLYGIQEGKAIDGNGTNDIDASSDFGISGQITINSLAIDPSQGLSELPIDTVAPQLDQTCSPTGSGRNEFTVTGRDGLPPSPTDMLSSQRAIADLGTPVNSNATQPTSTTNLTSSPEQLVEAQGWIIDEQGNVFLTAQVPSSNNQGTWQPQASCQADFSGKS